MIVISHRGNLTGPNKELENKITYIENALQFNFDVEIDVRFINNNWYLGHDYLQEQVDINWFKKYKDRLWLHCKNERAIIELSNTNLHYFWHENDKLTLTSKNIIWAYPSTNKIKNSIDVLPEAFLAEKYDFNYVLGICTDYPLKYYNMYKQ
jgi:hypothetical protein